MQRQDSEGLINYILSQANSGDKNWFGFTQQKILGINLAYEIAKTHADKLTPEEVADYAYRLNNAVYNRMIKKGD